MMSGKIIASVNAILADPEFAPAERPWRSRCGGFVRKR
jgi:hypothetical protein